MHHLVFGGIGREHDDLGALQRFLGTQCDQHALSVHLGHGQVADDEVGQGLHGLGHPFLAIVCLFNPVFPAESALEQLYRFLFVVDD